MKRLCAWWEETVDWWKKQEVEWYVGYATAIYIGVIILVMGAKLDELFCLKLNELGDFLAGAFGPVAFLWLVLGFLQQRKELRISSAALLMQAKELKDSVEQQTALVKVSEAQHAAYLEKLKNEEFERLAALEPNFRLEPGHLSGDKVNDIWYYDFALMNDGNICDKVLVFADIAGMRFTINEINAMAQGASTNMRVSFNRDLKVQDMVVTVSYRSRATKSFGEQIFDCSATLHVPSLPNVMFFVLKRSD